MKILLSLLVLLNVADAITTQFLVRLNIAYEGNPLLGPFAGKPGFIAIKVIGVIFAVFILWDIHRRHPKLATAVTVVFILLYALIVGWNISLFL